MDNMQPLVNKVAASSLITINLEHYYPAEPIVAFDIKEYLFRELLLREKDFREAMKAHNWEQYRGQRLAVYCSTDAIVPVWAYQLIAIQASPFATDIYMGTVEQALGQYYRETIAALDISAYQDQKIVIKGCSNKPVPTAAYLELAKRLRPVANSIMYGEPCSTVPLYKQAKPIG